MHRGGFQNTQLINGGEVQNKPVSTEHLLPPHTLNYKGVFSWW